MICIFCNPVICCAHLEGKREQIFFPLHHFLRVDIGGPKITGFLSTRIYLNSVRQRKGTSCHTHTKSADTFFPRNLCAHGLTQNQALFQDSICHAAAIINNSNLGPETTPETVLESIPYMEKLSELSGLPIWCTTARWDVAEKLQDKISNVFSLRLQEKYFDLPSQKQR